MVKTDEHEGRYEEILRRIQARKPLEAPAHAGLATVLDGLNAMGFLEDRRKRPPSTLSVYGPISLRGQTALTPQPPQPEGEGEKNTAGGATNWVGAVAWYKRRGYYHYRTVTLLGIWGVEAAGGITIMLGTKSLPFDAPVFNPEAYYRQIRRRFDLYYPDDGSPPPESTWRYGTLYEASRRLAIRDELEAALRKWGTSGGFL